MKRVINFQRWWIQPPMLDESLRSVLNRAAALYGRTSAQLWASLNSDDPRPTGDVESPSSAALRRMATAIGMPASELLAHRQPDTPWLLAPHARNVCCPMCWDEDRARGEPCSIRRGWNRLLRTTYPQHGCPLRIAPEQWARFTPSHPLPIPQLSEDPRPHRILRPGLGAEPLFRGALARRLARQPSTCAPVALGGQFQRERGQGLPIDQLCSGKRQLDWTHPRHPTPVRARPETPMGLIPGNCRSRAPPRRPLGDGLDAAARPTG